MDILQYLIELLKIRKEIGIEGLGTLYKKKTPGRYDAELHSFVPPSYVLEFTNDVKEHFNLNQYIQSKRSISEESAEYFIHEFVEKVKKNLAEAGTYDLEKLGRFIFEDEQLTFHPTQDINIGFDFFALPSVTAELTPTPNTTADSQIDAETVGEVEELVIDSADQGEEIENIATTNFEDEEVQNATANEGVEEVHVAEEETESEHVESEDSNHEEPPVATAAEEVDEIPLVEEIEEAANEVNLAEKETGSAHVESEDSNHEELSVATTPEAVEENHAEPDVEHEDTNKLDNEETAVETTPTELVDVRSEEEENITEIANSTKSIEENEATQDEVYEEIAEASGYTEISENTVEDTDTWDFNDEHVISQEDIQDEKLPLAEDDDDDDQNTKNEHKKTHQGIKIKATTHPWDFDNAADTQNSLDKNEAGEFYRTDEPEEFEEEVTVMSLYKKLTIGVLAVCLIIAAIYLYNPDLINSLNKNEAIGPDQKMAIPLPQNNLKTQQDSLSFADSIMENAEKAGLTVEPAKDTLKVTANAKPLNRTTYEIIGAALATKTEVEKYIATMKKNGFDAKVANMPGKIYQKISIASYANRDSATKELKKLKVRLKNSDLYIFEDKNK